MSSKRSSKSPLGLQIVYLVATWSSNSPLHRSDVVQSRSLVATWPLDTELVNFV